MSFTVAIVGRPNVGKSTLFNRLVGKKLALVDDRPGVTRDRREGEGNLAGLAFRVIDTAGLEDAEDDSLEARMRRQTELAIAEADVCLFLIDARAGVTPLDAHFARLLRKSPTPVLLVANKCEGGAGVPGLAEAYALGLGEPLALSAEHGEGLADLYEALAAHAPGPDGGQEDGPQEGAGPAEGGPLQLAIVGRPNVGKSTLVNALVGEERLLTGPEAGITRDAIAVDWEHGGRQIRLIDTAGLRRRAKVVEKLEGMSAADTLRAVKYAQVVILVVDAGLPLERQDLAIARHVVEEGRALVIALNKWDAVADKNGTLRAAREKAEESLSQAKGVALVPVSGLQRRNLDRLIDAALAAEAVWNRRVATGPLNRWLEAAMAAHPPPLVNGRRVKLRYMTQAKTRPPTFAAFCNMPAEMPDSYLRYLVNGLREAFDLPGVPLRLNLRKSRNPFADDRD